MLAGYGIVLCNAAEESSAGVSFRRSGPLPGSIFEIQSAWHRERKYERKAFKPKRR